MFYISLPLRLFPLLSPVGKIYGFERMVLIRDRRTSLDVPVRAEKRAAASLSPAQCFSDERERRSKL
jgi:hypothetical protein